MELDEASARLQAHGEVHALDRGCFGVLQALLQQAGTIVDKDPLLAAGWPGRVVSENSLTKAIGRLRQVLDDAEGKLLCTAHGYGYRLATRAEWLPTEDERKVPASEALLPASAPEPRPVPASRRRSVLLVAGLLVLTLLGWLGWRYANAPGATIRATAAHALGGRASIAVLPFADMSQQGDQRYFSDGLADELLDRLAKLPQLRVASRTSSFAYRDSTLGVEQIGRELGVANLLEGSVRRDGERLRITVQLINAQDGFHLWSETYDRRVTDLFEVQDDISRAVVSALRLKLLPEQTFAVSSHGTKSVPALNAFLMGKRYRRMGNADNDRRAKASFESAIRLDPKFSTAYAALADVLGGDAIYADSAAQVRAGKLRSIELMDQAIALEPDRADYYVSRADFLYSTRHDWAAAQHDLDVAARLLHARTPEVLMRQTRLLMALGRVQEAIAADREAIAADARSDWAWAHLGYHLAVAGEFSQAHEALKMAAKLGPQDDHIAYYAGLTWLLEGKPQEAAAEFDRSGTVFRLVGLSAARFDAGDKAASQTALDTLASRYAAVGAYQVAQAYAWRGEKDQAFAWLERARQQEDAGVMTLGFDPFMRRLHGDARYGQWLRRLNLADEPAYRNF